MNPLVKQVLESYPVLARDKFLEIRNLVYMLAKEHKLGEIEETLKWGQPAYLCKSGSTLRIDRGGGASNDIELFFNCKTLLMETFKEIFHHELKFRGNRVVVVPVGKPVSPEVERCILMTLDYHRRKKLPLLGA